MLRKAFGILAQLFDRCITGLGYFCSIAILLVMMAISYDVLMRYFFNRPTVWATDFGEYTLLYLTFLAAPWVLKNRGHIRIDIVLHLLSARAIAILELVTSILGLAACLILSWKGIGVTWDKFHSGVTQPRLIAIPVFTLIMVVPLGFLLLSGQFLCQIQQLLASLHDKEAGQK